jgi:hypothetical protein
MSILGRNIFVALNFILTVLLLLSSCSSEKTNETSKDSLSLNVQQQKKDYLALVMSFDTLAMAQVKRTVTEEDSLLALQPDHQSNPFNYYFRGRKLSLDKKPDSAIMVFKQMKGTQQLDDIELLKRYHLLDHSLGKGSTVESVVMQRIFSAIEDAEKMKSKFTYRFYDLLAKAYYQNRNDKKSLTYAALYFDNHPFKSHPVIKQRYFDISFLLAYRLGDFKKMAYYNAQARTLAKKIGNSLAIARTYDYEAQIYSAQSKHKEALACSKIYFNYLKKTNNLNDIAYNNLATAFNLNHQPDSAIFYYKAAIALERKDMSGNQKHIYYKGLLDAYKFKGDFKNALASSDSAHAIELRNSKAIEAVKVAEMHEKYEAEKKDENIQQLKSRNQLNETIIKQQRWTIFLTLLVFVGILSFFYVIQRQQRLRQKNKLLKVEVQQLNMEQKLLQAQLNPHFIFNAIANLQGLVASGHTDESVRYLKSFSGLLRSILEQNRKDFIEIEEEVNSLENYIQLQQMRYADAFEYRIDIDDELDLNEILIPPMLIQPFVENAIEHGFRNITYKGMLRVAFKIDGPSLNIRVEDNGSGLTNAPADKQKKQSLAQVIIKERFDLLFTSKGQTAAFKVTDKQKPDTGVLVEINMPIIKE